MAFRSSFVAFSLLSFAFSMSSAALLTSGILGGVITCTDTSLAIAGTYPVIPRARVDLVCGSGSLVRVVKSVLTNSAGVYNFLFTSVDTILNDPGKCYLSVTLPPNSCFINVPSGTLRIPIIVLSTVDALVGQLLVFAPGPFSFVH